MAKEDVQELLKFLEPFDEKIAETALWLRDFVWDRYPECIELIYDGPAALAFGWTPSGRTSDTFITIAIYNNACVQFGFYYGAVLRDPKKVLEGEGKQYRFVRVTDTKDFPVKYVIGLMHEAHTNSLATMKSMTDLPKGSTVVKSVSAKKRRPIRNE